MTSGLPAPRSGLAALPHRLLIDIIAGARPNFMKIAPIIEVLRRRGAVPTASVSHSSDSCVSWAASPTATPVSVPPASSAPLPAPCSPFSYRLIHTGQHYDRAMSGSFFEQLGIPEPDINLGVGSGTQAEQTGSIMVRYEKALSEQRADLCLVVGDVTSTMACAIVARKLGIPVAHVEGGIRSGDWTMPEEINRVVTDSITNWFFTTSETANANLRAAGVSDDRIVFVGNTMIDTLLKQMPNLRPAPVYAEAGLQPGAYLVLTLHRPANVDDPAKLGALLAAIETGARGLPVVFPVHPRTRKVMERAGLLPPLAAGPQDHGPQTTDLRGPVADTGPGTASTGAASDRQQSPVGCGESRLPTGGAQSEASNDPLQEGLLSAQREVAGPRSGCSAGPGNGTPGLPPGSALPAPRSLLLTDPLGYLEFNHLVRHAKAVITDSGGITEETTVMGVPCLTLRDNTERPETVTVGTNRLIGTNPANLAPAFEQLFAGQWPQGGIPEKWDGHAAERIVAALERLLAPSA